MIDAQISSDTTDYVNTTNTANATAKRVLIAEDEVSMAKALQLKLNTVGITADIVHNGDQAIIALQQHQYSVLLLDLMMPEVDGWEVLQFAKNNSVSTKIIITSNLTQDEDKQKANSLGAIDFIVKADTPISEIADRVKELLF